MDTATTQAESTNCVSMPENTADAEIPLKITGEQTIRNSDALYRSLVESLDGGASLVVDLSEVQECDAVLLQLLYATRRSALERGRGFRIATMSPAVREEAIALGLDLADLVKGSYEGAVTGNGI